MRGDHPQTWAHHAGAQGRLSTWRYSQLLRPMLGFALLAHVVFLALFVLLDVPFMVFVNVISILLYAVMVGLTSRIPKRLLFLLASVEVILHAVLATHYVGWDSGFHYYLLILIPMAAFLSEFRVMERSLYVVLLTVISGMLAFRYIGQATVVQLDSQTLVLLHTGNIAAAFVGLAMASLHYSGAVHEAEAVVLQAREKLELLASTDPLTGLLNRRSMEPLLQRLLDTRRRTAVLLVDIDHFKAFNDEFGHQLGDQVLEIVGATLRDNLRNEDAAARWGGEEFLMVFPDRTREDAIRIADRLRNAIAGCWKGCPGRSISATIGIALTEPDDTTLSVINRADRALLEGKRSGRNTTALATRTEQPPDTTTDGMFQKNP